MDKEGEFIKARAVIPIVFSTVTNTSKKIAYQTQTFLEERGFIPTVTNIGDIDKQEFIGTTGEIIFILSTYGNGGSPADGEDFVHWLQNLKGNTTLEKMRFSILGLGNRAFEHFAGNSRKFKECLVGLGATQFHEIVFCNSSSDEESAAKKFDPWCSALSEKLEAKYELKDMRKDLFLQKYKITLTDEATTNWEENSSEWKEKLGKEFVNYYWDSYSAEVVHIKELRQKDDGRSTLWVRAKIPSEMTNLEPACNINICPQNVRKPGESELKGYITIEGVKETSKIPYPPMKAESLWKITNFSQHADMNILKKAIRDSPAGPEAKEKYKKYLDDPEELEKSPIRCGEIARQLNPGLNFVVELGINSVRPYTLSSWQPQKGYFDLTVALDPMGLTSNYLKSRPSALKIQKVSSSFYIPEGRPVIMIANGSGIAPFRSLIQYFAAQESKDRPEITLYFGIQNKDIDFYYREEWESYEKDGLLKIRLAESRVNPDKKVYVQELVKEDKVLIKEHLFDRNGVIFICGSRGMAKSVDAQIFESIKLKEPIPFKAFKVSNELVKKKSIVKEIFE